MTYPTIDAVESVDVTQLARWYRFLPSPGQSAIGNPEFETVMESERTIMNRIKNRFSAMGGFTPEISKAIGWERRTDD